MGNSGVSRLRVVAAGSLCCFLLLSFPAVRAETIRIAATVNEDVITSTDVSERAALVLHSADIPPSDENRRRVTPRVVQNLVDETLQLQEAKRLSILVAPEEVDKAIETLSNNRHLPAGGLKKEFEANGLSIRSLEQEIRAQLSWNKVMQRKVRRNVTISQDELTRAQQAEAAAPDTSELRVTVLLFPLSGTEKEEVTRKRLENIAAAIKAGNDFATVAKKYAKNGDIRLSPPVWVIETKLPPDVAQGLKSVNPGEVSPPIRVGNVIQFVRVLERRVTKKPAIGTEVTVKQVTVPVPVDADKDTLGKVADTVQQLKAGAGSCDDPAVPATPMPAKAEFVHVPMSELPEDVRVMLARMEVGQVSDPSILPDKMQLLLLCERREGAGNAQALESLRQKLFGEKMDLEAQKLLRNLRRDATIDVRDTP